MRTQQATTGYADALCARVHRGPEMKTTSTPPVLARACTPHDQTSPAYIQTSVKSTNGHAFIRRLFLGGGTRAPRFSSTSNRCE